ncbi:unnamed protein product [Pichia kudriavzevii]
MDVMVPYLYNSIDKAASLASPYVSPEKLDQVCRWLKQHDEAVLYSTLGALVLGTLYLASSGNGKTKKRSKKPSSKKSYQVKVKKEKVVPVDRRQTELRYDQLSQGRAKKRLHPAGGPA